ncbi:MAG: Gfo/Idh/MocA family oxidoreductase [Anaerolineae bacterium]|nr:Gfo/Idh/MocA family oxidoreductase [Anaerolineae bacterium]
MFKCAIIGVSGGRARGLADAYQYIKRGELTAVSTRQPDKLAAFAGDYGVTARYTDYREMFAREKPDLVHVNTPPTVRLEILQAAQRAGIPALIVEKPLACQGEDFIAIREFAKTNKMKVAINHQLHFHPRRTQLQHLVYDGQIGDVQFIEASARMNLAYQGTHSLQAIGAFNPGARPVTVFGQVSGSRGLQPSHGQHYAPDQSLAKINYDNGVHALLQCGENAIKVRDDERTHTHKRIAVYGTRGYVKWTMWSWETLVDGLLDGGAHEYPDEDILGQARMTEAMFDWLLDDTAVHPLNLGLALQDFNIILGMYMSALHHVVIDLPVEPEPDLINQLRQRLE